MVTIYFLVGHQTPDIRQNVFDGEPNAGHSRLLVSGFWRLVSEGRASVPWMFELAGSPVPVRRDLIDVYESLWTHFASPGATMTGPQRIALLESARARDVAAATAEGVDPVLTDLGTTLLHDPPAVHGDDVAAAADTCGFPPVVETIAIVSMLSAVDGAHRALSSSLEPLPTPRPGEPTQQVREGLKRRRTHVPVPPGPIPVTLDLIPIEGEVFQSSFGPQYMTEEEMADDRFARSPGLDRAQIEVVSSRTSIINECFY